MKYCMYCGRQMQEAAQFCPYCGKDVSREKEEQPVYRERPAERAVYSDAPVERRQRAPRKSAAPGRGFSLAGHAIWTYIACGLLATGALLAMISFFANMMFYTVSAMNALFITAACAGGCILLLRRPALPGGMMFLPLCALMVPILSGTLRCLAGQTWMSTGDALLFLVLYAAFLLLLFVEKGKFRSARVLRYVIAGLLAIDVLFQQLKVFRAYAFQYGAYSQAMTFFLVGYILYLVFAPLEEGEAPLGWIRRARPEPENPDAEDPYAHFGGWLLAFSIIDYVVLGLAIIAYVILIIYNLAWGVFRSGMYYYYGGDGLFAVILSLPLTLAILTGVVMLWLSMLKRLRVRDADFLRFYLVTTVATALVELAASMAGQALWLTLFGLINSAGFIFLGLLYFCRSRRMRTWMGSDAYLERSWLGRKLG